MVRPFLSSVAWSEAAPSGETENKISWTATRACRPWLGAALSMGSADGERQGGFRDALRRPALPSEEYRYQRRSNSSRLVRRLVCLDEKTVDDGLTAGMLDGFRALRRPGKKRVDMLDDIVRGHEAPGLAREQCPGFRV